MRADANIFHNSFLAKICEYSRKYWMNKVSNKRLDKTRTRSMCLEIKSFARSVGRSVACQSALSIYCRYVINWNLHPLLKCTMGEEEFYRWVTLWSLTISTIYFLLRVSCFSRRNHQATSKNNDFNLRYTNSKLKSMSLILRHDI